MKLSSFLPSAATFVVVLLSTSPQTIATPVPSNQNTNYYSQSANLDLLTIAHKAIDEVQCAEDCLFNKYPKESPCKDEHCRSSCTAFTNAYWSQLNSCIKTACSPKSSVAKAYIANMKLAVDQHCNLMEFLFEAFRSPTVYNKYNPTVKKSEFSGGY
ncbi:hypothetical protein H072_10304 [Dactylellina haptotyla CBS 200.50]|uniref:Extracellular membrane protein CFEM domain-containing protein n=1 Tax=Dactylellina haptotyla (strain CBS 200.50) TaxID=1284197 RepID=S8BAS9_DACHA|nr:hypothetical protein H072_10304 [Dactylellina haptotyla CBS 200.50]